MTVQCIYCGARHRHDDPSLWRRVTGWERKGFGGSRRGGSDIVLRQPGEDVACQFCIENMKKGRPATQEGIF